MREQTFYYVIYYTPGAQFNQQINRVSIPSPHIPVYEHVYIIQRKLPEKSICER